MSPFLDPNPEEKKSGSMHLFGDKLPAVQNSFNINSRLKGAVDRELRGEYIRIFPQISGGNFV